jgi:hypothetical protein
MSIPFLTFSGEEAGGCRKGFARNLKNEVRSIVRETRNRVLAGQTERTWATYYLKDR